MQQDRTWLTECSRITVSHSKSSVTVVGSHLTDEKHRSVSNVVNHDVSTTHKINIMSALTVTSSVTEIFILLIMHYSKRY